MCPTRSSPVSFAKGSCSMSTELDLARGWLIKAASDLAAGRLVVEGAGPYDIRHRLFSRSTGD